MKSMTKKAANFLGKRGNVGGGWAGIAMGFGVALIGLAIVAIVLGAFKTTQSSGTVAYTILNNTETFLLNATSQLGSAGTILGIMAIVAIVAVFGFLGYQKFNSSR
jgi:hypothetical protein